MTPGGERNTQVILVNVVNAALCLGSLPEPLTLPRGGIRSCTCVSVPGPLHSQSPGLTTRGLACPEQPFICDGWEMVVNTWFFTPWQDTLRAWTTASQKSPVGLSPGAPSGSRALCMGPFSSPSHFPNPTCASQSHLPNKL